MHDGIEERFWARVDKSGGDNACWPFLGGEGHAYGRIFSGGRAVYAHRIACELANGPQPPDKPFACHSRKCITARCVNGRHLRWDTHEENIRDASAVGSMRGDVRGVARITQEQAESIWRLWGAGETQAEIVQALGVSLGEVANITRGRTWRHVTGLPPYRPIAQGRPGRRKAFAILDGQIGAAS